MRPSLDWFAAIDLKDAYFHVSILPRHRPFLRFRFAFEGRAYQYKALPFGLSLSPRVFTKVVEAALVPLREAGIRILNYLDDWLILAQSRALLCEHRDMVLSHLSRLGLQVNRKRANSPLQRISFLGMELDSVNLTARLSEERAQSMLRCLESLSARGRFHWNIFRGSWGIWHPQPLSRRSDCFIWDRFSVGFTTESRDGHGATAHTGSHSPRPAVAPSALVGPCSCRAGVPLEQVSRHVLFQQTPLPRAGGPCATGTQPRALDRAPAAVAYQLPRVAGSMACSAPLQNLLLHEKHYWSARTTLRPLRTSTTRRSTLPSHVATRPPSPPLESEASEVASRRSCPRRAQSCSRRALTSARPSGRMATPPRGTPADLETLRGRSGRPVCLPGHVSLPVVFLPVRGDPRYRCVACSWPRGLRKYAFPPVSLLAQTLCKVREDEEQVLLVRLTGPIGRGSQNWCSSRQPLLGKFLWGGIYFLREGAPSGTRAQTCGISTYGPWTGRGGSKWATSSGSKHYHFCQGLSTRQLQAEVEPVRRLVFSPPGGPP